MVVKWTFLDLTDSSTAQFEINPNDGGSPALAKNITTTSTVAPGGATLIFEGASQPQDFTFSGTVLTQSQYDMIVTWFTKTHPIRLTDDLGRSIDIYIKTFTPKRTRKGTGVTHPWRHDYTVTAVQL